MTEPTAEACLAELEKALKTIIAVGYAQTSPAARMIRMLDIAEKAEQWLYDHQKPKGGD